MPTHKWGTSFRTGNDTPITHSQTVTASADLSIEETIGDGETPAINCAIDVSALKSLFIWSDKALTLTVNGDGQEIDIAAGQLIQWKDGDESANPLTDDVVTIDVNNAGGVDASFKLYALQDATP